MPDIPITEPGERGLAGLVSDLATDAQNLIRGELALARAELDQKLDTALMGLVWLFGGMFVAFAGLIIVLIAAAQALSLRLPAWAAFLIIGVVVLAIGAVLCRSGIANLSLRHLTPDRTARNLSRDARAVKENL